MIKYKRLPLETLVNVRDLGGFAAMAGKVTRYGVFLRSDCPVNLSPHDLQFLQNYGITLTIDLRGNDEVQKTPSALSGLDGVTYIHCPISEEHSVLQAGKKELPPFPLEGNFDLGDIYVEIAETAKAWVKRVFTICARWRGGILYHCFLGKDRTGIITALLLGACGVSDTDILMDYSSSMSCLRPRYNNMHPEMLPQKRGRPDYCWGYFGSVPESMEALLYHLKDKYGGVTAYLQTCGVSAQSIRILQEKLLE